MKGRKRHEVVDTLGFYLSLVVHRADIQDRDGARLALAQARCHPLAGSLKKVWADSGYRGALVDWTQQECGWTLEIVPHPKDAAGQKIKAFVIVPKRWIAERSFAWMGGSRRLSLDYEENPLHSRAWALLAQIKIMLKRLRL